MRATIIVCSVISAITFVVFGGLFNAVTSGLGFDTLAPYNEPFRVVATFIGDVPGIALALAALGLALYDSARRGGVAWFIALLIWPLVPLLAASLMFAGVLAEVIYWFIPLAFIPLAPLLYALAAPRVVAVVPAPAPVPAAPRMSPAASPLGFSLFIGILALVAVSGGLFLFPGFHATNTPAQSGPPALTVTQTSAAANCASGSYPPLTLANTGTTMLQWTAQSDDPAVTANPTQGSLAPSASVTITLSGQTTAPDVIVRFLASGQPSVPAKFGCQAGASK